MIPILANPVAQKLLASILLGVFLYVLRRLVLRWLTRIPFESNEDRRKWIVSLQNIAVLVLIFGLLLIWATEVKSFALSLAAIAVALVLATKELLLCVSGGILRTTSRAFSLGDRIEIEGVRGDVIDESLLITTVLEVGPGTNSHQYTGRSVTFPNSLLLSSPVINETYMDEYVLHPFRVPLKLEDDWQKAEKILLRVAADECKPFFLDAQTHMNLISRTRGLETPSAEPRITVHLNSPEVIELLIRVPAPARRKGRIEQAILRKFLEEFRGPRS